LLDKIDVAIIDDDEDFRELLGFYFESDDSLNIAIPEINHIEDILKFDYSAYDVVVFDYIFHGVKATEQILQVYKQYDIPIVIVWTGAYLKEVDPRLRELFPIVEKSGVNILRAEIIWYAKRYKKNK
jgi:chemotaxis response regulator CheB